MFSFLVYCNTTVAVDDLQFNNEVCFCGAGNTPDMCLISQVRIVLGP